MGEFANARPDLRPSVDLGRARRIRKAYEEGLPLQVIAAMHRISTAKINAICADLPPRPTRNGRPVRKRTTVRIPNDLL